MLFLFPRGRFGIFMMGVMNGILTELEGAAGLVHCLIPLYK